MRYLRILIGVGCVLLGLSRASAESLTLIGVSPGEEVGMQDSAVNLANGDYGDGVLDWSNNGSTTVANVFTYCVDVASVISPGDTYTFDTDSSLPVNPTYTTTVDDAIYSLLNTYQSQFVTTLSGTVNGSSTTNWDNGTATWNVVAAELQIAL
ncbi:MAG TPA: hypothetical protein VL992_14980 [Tepidisphaeraceae bacterium]|nr:hypothetical protein [Tepidisphaeraceae bacterium]